MFQGKNASGLWPTVNLFLSFEQNYNRLSSLQIVARMCNEE
jgi:hypothetical protein